MVDGGVFVLHQAVVEKTLHKGFVRFGDQAHILLQGIGAPLMPIQIKDAFGLFGKMNGF